MRNKVLRTPHPRTKPTKAKAAARSESRHGAWEVLKRGVCVYTVILQLMVPLGGGGGGGVPIIVCMYVCMYV